MAQLDYKKLTEGVRQLMQRANTQAQRFNHEYIGTEHILLALVNAPSPAVDMIRRFDVDPRKVRLEVEKFITSDGPKVTMAKLPQTPTVRRVMEQAFKYAEKTDYVGTVHMLLALLAEPDSVAYRVLYDLGVRDTRIAEMMVEMGSDKLAEKEKDLGHAVDRNFVETAVGVAALMEKAIDYVRRKSLIEDDIRDAIKLFTSEGGFHKAMAKLYHALGEEDPTAKLDAAVATPPFQAPEEKS